MKKEVEIKIELTQEEFQKIAKDFNNFQLERTFGYFKEDFSNIKEGIFPRIKYIEGSNKEILFTVKRKRSEDSQFFEREEMEVKVDEKGLEDLREMIKSLGFTREIIFEKKRKTIKKNKVIINLDQLPFGFFIELEGEPKIINKYLDEFHLANRPRITKAYLGLWGDYRKAHGIAEENCVFKPKTVAN